VKAAKVGQRILGPLDIAKGVYDAASNGDSLDGVGLAFDVAGIWVPLVADEAGLLIDIGPHIEYSP
jgi:hypothetical protein